MIAGAVEGGAALVVPKDSSLKEPADFRGKVIATPQLGNTQDVSARAWFSRGGLHVTQRGGDVTILPTPNPEQLSLFRQGKLDGVWTVEPWVSRLVLTAGGRVLVDERSPSRPYWYAERSFSGKSRRWRKPWCRRMRN